MSAENLKMIWMVCCPNPYVGTNAMEQAVINPFLNQPRKIMFANVPSNCVITIFTQSGVKVKTINKNDSSGGMVPGIF